MPPLAEAGFAPLPRPDRLAPIPSASAGSSWPPAWFGIAEGSAQDVSERVEEILAEGL